DDTNIPTGMQAQCLYQPYEISLDGTEPEDKYVETSVDFINSHISFLTTDGVQVNPPFKRKIGGYSIQGLSLPLEVCKRILHENAERIIGI
ncbi:MAG: hypothetical protein PHT33_10545, partial [bacterium]|nr:hypothetical protein [bacterium]